MEKRKKTLVQVRMSDKTIEEINRLKEETGASTKAEVIRDALALFSSVENARKTPGRIFIQSENKKPAPDKELIIPWKNIEKIKLHKISKGIFGFVPDYYYFVIMCKNNISYLKPINRHIIAKIQKRIKQLDKSIFINQ